MDKSLKALSDYLNAMHQQLFGIYEKAFRDDVLANEEACKVM